MKMVGKSEEEGTKWARGVTKTRIDLLGAKSTRMPWTVGYTEMEQCDATISICIG